MRCPNCGNPNAVDGEPFGGPHGSCVCPTCSGSRNAAIEEAAARASTTTSILAGLCANHALIHLLAEVNRAELVAMAVDLADRMHEAFLLRLAPRGKP